MRIIQMLPTLLSGDAVGNDAIALDKVLKTEGFDTCIYAECIGGNIPEETARNISSIGLIEQEDIIIYHLAIGSDLNFRLPVLPGKKIIIYHNITPYRFFSGYGHRPWHECRAGRKGAEFLSDKADCCFADSDYNKLDLQAMGYRCPIKVLPILIPFEDYDKAPSSRIIERYSDDGIRNILFTGRIAPNKCQEDIIAAFYQYHRHYNERSRLILVGSYGGMETYYARLQQYVKLLGIEKEVVFTGHIPFSEILAYYHIADAFVCMSEHEGFCVPLLEAMHFDIPVIAYESTAIPYTLGGSGVLLKEKDPAVTAGIINCVLENEKTRKQILDSQNERLKDFEHDVIEKQFLTLLNDFIEESKRGRY